MKLLLTVFVFLALKLWEIGRVVFCIAAGMAIWFGATYFIARCIWETPAFDDYCITISAVFFVAAAVLVLFAMRDEILGWIRGNWRKAKRIIDDRWYTW